jgi:hypothetical protein
MVMVAKTFGTFVFPRNLGPFLGEVALFFEELLLLLVIVVFWGTSFAPWGTSLVPWGG